MGLLPPQISVPLAVIKAGVYIKDANEDSVRYESMMAEILSYMKDKDYKTDDVLSGTVIGSAEEYSQSPLKVMEALRKAIYLADSDETGVAGDLKNSQRLMDYAPAIANVYKYHSDMDPKVLGKLVYEVERMGLPKERFTSELLRSINFIKGKNIELDDDFRWKPLLEKELEGRKNIPDHQYNFDDQLNAEKEYNPSLYDPALDWLDSRMESLSLGVVAAVKDPSYARQIGDPDGIQNSRVKALKVDAFKKKFSNIVSGKDNVGLQEWAIKKKQMLSLYEAELKSSTEHESVAGEFFELWQNRLAQFEGEHPEGFSAEDLSAFVDDSTQNFHIALRTDDIAYGKRFTKIAPKKRVAETRQEGVGVWKNSLERYTGYLSKDQRNNLAISYRRLSQSQDLSPAELQKQKSTLREEVSKYTNNAMIQEQLLKDFEDARLSGVRERELKESVEKGNNGLVPKGDPVIPPASVNSELRVAPATEKIVRESLGKQLAPNGLGEVKNSSSGSSKLAASSVLALDGLRQHDDIPVASDTPFKSDNTVLQDWRSNSLKNVQEQSALFNNQASPLVVRPQASTIFPSSIYSEVLPSSPAAFTPAVPNILQQSVAGGQSFWASGVLPSAQTPFTPVAHNILEQSVARGQSFESSGIRPNTRPILTPVAANIAQQPILTGQAFGKPVAQQSSLSMPVNTGLPAGGIVKNIAARTNDSRQVSPVWQPTNNTQSLSPDNGTAKIAGAGGAKGATAPDISGSLQRGGRLAPSAGVQNNGFISNSAQNGSARSDAGKGTGAKAAVGNMTIHYNPTFNLPESAAGLQALVKQASQMALADFERLLQRSNQGKARQEYGVV